MKKIITFLQQLRLHQPVTYRRLFFFSLFSFVACLSSTAQTVTVSGQCITGTISLSKISDVDGKAAYQGTGTVAGFASQTVSLYWLGATDNVWVLDFDGQPYYQNTCNNTAPPLTTDATCAMYSVVSGTTCTGAPALVITSPGVLPVKWISFTAARNNNHVQLEWKTATETNNKGFDIQRSSDGNIWVKIGFVTGAGTSATANTYGYTDNTPGAGKNYYRLVQYDFDNHQSYSPVIAVDFGQENLFYTLGNNVSTGSFALTIQSAQPVALCILDFAGRKLIEKTAAAGPHQLDLSRYPSGIYLLQLKKEAQIFTEKLIKK